jgi:hypothetical protein
MQRFILSLAILATLGFTASTALAQSPDNPSHNQAQLITTDMGQVNHGETSNLLHQVWYPGYYRPYYNYGYYPYYNYRYYPYYYSGFYRPDFRFRLDFDDFRFHHGFHHGFHHWGGRW